MKSSNVDFRGQLTDVSSLARTKKGSVDRLKSRRTMIEPLLRDLISYDYVVESP
jgi:hypothetical protein